MGSNYNLIETGKRELQPKSRGVHFSPLGCIAAQYTACRAAVPPSASALRHSLPPSSSAAPPRLPAAALGAALLLPPPERYAAQVALPISFSATHLICPQGTWSAHLTRSTCSCPSAEVANPAGSGSSLNNHSTWNRESCGHADQRAADG